LYGAESLHQDVLDRFVNSCAGQEPFFLSSAFPFAGGVRFLPKPIASGTNCVSEADEKAMKRVRFVSHGILKAILDRTIEPFCRKKCVNGRVAWVTKQEREALEAEWSDDFSGDVVLWKKAVVPRVVLDRVTSASQIWQFGEVTFAENAGLWFAVEFNRAARQDVRERFEAALRLLGDTGLGGERGAGRGLFEFCRGVEIDLPEASNSQRFVTLAPVCPRKDQLTRLMGDGARYELMPRRGWVCSPEGGNLRRKTVWMFAEGSVLTGPGLPRPGQLVDVTPRPCPHNVWRYGFAFPVGVASQ
jgi:CRISPR-associated protein Csm4